MPGSPWSLWGSMKFSFYKTLIFLPRTNQNPMVENLGMPFSVLILPVFNIKNDVPGSPWYLWSSMMFPFYKL